MTYALRAIRRPTSAILRSPTCTGRSPPRLVSNGYGPAARAGGDGAIARTLEPGLVARVAAEVFDLDAARCATPPAGRLALPTTPGQRGSSDMQSGGNSSAFSPKSAEKLAAGAPQKQKNQSFSPPSSRSGWAGGTP